MIKIVEGNLLDATEDIIGHQTNCMGGFGSGIAKQIRAKYPVVYEKFLDHSERYSPHRRLGRVQFIDIGNGKHIANLFGQLNYGKDKSVRYTDYNALHRALSTLKIEANLNNLSVALPYNIGCGLANGDWNVVYEMIDEIFDNYEVTLYKYEGVE